MAKKAVKKSISRRRTVARTRKSAPEIVWKIVDAQCVQLADAVKSARIPFLLALLWAFLWGWSLYCAEYGYLESFYRKRIAESVSFAQETTNKEKIEQFNRDCDRVVGQHLEFNKSDKLRRDDCLETLKRRREWVEKASLESTTLTFPGGFAKMELSDLGIVGQAALLLILAWVFYSTRRENHAVLAFVDFDKNTRRLGYLFPEKFWLIPKTMYLSAEHLTYAYQAVAQRFMFILSRYSRPLLSTTIILYSLPAAIAALHVLSDIEGLQHYGFVRHLVIRFGASLILLALVCFATWRIVRYVVETSLILNGWYLASTKIWINQWSETTERPASIVEIDAAYQNARQATPSEEASLRVD